MDSATVYILYSSRINQFYIGFTELPVVERLRHHNSDYYQGGYTSKGIPWELYLTISCKESQQARRIEAYIKSMKSRKYIESLKANSERVEWLVQKFS
jgi:putative endonuclease